MSETKNRCYSIVPPLCRSFACVPHVPASRPCDTVRCGCSSRAVRSKPAREKRVRDTIFYSTSRVTSVRQKRFLESAVDEIEFAKQPLNSCFARSNTNEHTSALFGEKLKETKSVHSNGSKFSIFLCAGSNLVSGIHKKAHSNSRRRRVFCVAPTNKKALLLRVRCV